MVCPRVLHNARMKSLARLGWGIVIYAIVYLAWNGFAIYGFTQGILPRLCELAVLVCVAAAAGHALGFRSWKDILPYSCGWALIAIGLDAIFILPFSGVQMYANLNIWIGYALVALLPLAAPQLRFFEHHSSELG